MLILNLMPAKPFKPKTPVWNTAQIDSLIDGRWYQLTDLERLSRLHCVKQDCIKKKGTWVFLVDDKLSFTVHFENLVKKLKVSIKPKQTTALVHIHFTKQC